MEDKKEEKTIGMSDEELEEMSWFANWLYMKYGLEKLPKKDLFILGFIRGREFTLNQLGVFDFDEEDENAEIELPQILKDYLEHEQKKVK